MTRHVVWAAAVAIAVVALLVGEAAADASTCSVDYIKEGKSGKMDFSVLTLKSGLAGACSRRETYPLLCVTSYPPSLWFPSPTLAALLARPLLLLVPRTLAALLVPRWVDECGLFLPASPSLFIPPGATINPNSPVHATCPFLYAAAALASLPQGVHGHRHPRRQQEPVPDQHLRAGCPEPTDVCFLPRHAIPGRRRRRFPEAHL